MARNPRRVVRGPRFDGARELDGYLRERAESVPHFCERASLDRILVQRMLAGGIRRPPSIDMILGIARATGGAVHAGLWGAATLRVDEPTSGSSLEDAATGTDS